MAEDFIELGIEGIDKLVDKHFHKVPNKYIDPHTYRHPIHHRRHGSGEEKREEDVEEQSAADEHDVAYDRRPEEPYQQQRMYEPPDRNGYDRGYGYIHPSQDIRDPYRRDERPRRRPEGLVRRSSSQPDEYRDRDREARRVRRMRSLSDERGTYKKRTGGGEATRATSGPSNTQTVVLAVLGVAAAGLAATKIMDVVDKPERESGSRGEKTRLSNRERHGGGGHREQRGEGRRSKGGGRR